MRIIMADNVVKKGHLVIVDNKNKKWNEKVEYVAMHVEDSDNGEHCLLFTRNEIHKYFKPVYIENLNIDAGDLFRFIVNNRRYVITRVICKDKSFIIKLPWWLYLTAKERANKNPEDIPAKSFWTDLFD